VDERAQNTFTVTPVPLAASDVETARWSVYLIRVDLEPLHNAPSALKIGMVGSGTIQQRLNSHSKTFGPATLIAAWTLAHEVGALDPDHAWRVVEQYEARLQFAPEFEDPAARLRRLRPDTLVYSYEWFDDDQRVIEAVQRHAPRPVTLPHGWALANTAQPTERTEETPADA
jgi:hypothetical protein